MNIQYPYYLLGAEAYGTGTYNCGDFEQGCAAGASTGSDGGLSYTGYNIIIPVALAAALIIAAAALLITKFIRKRKASQV